MTTLVQGRNTKVDVATMRESLQQTENTWIKQIRRKGMDHFNKVGFPSGREEAWRHINLTPLRNTAFTLATGEVTPASRAVLSKSSFGKKALVELVFVNGLYAAELSSLTRLPQGVQVMNIAEAVKAEHPVLLDYLGKVVKPELTPFAAINAEFINDGAFIHLPRGTTLEGVIHLLFISTSANADAPTVSHPHVLIVAEDNVHAAIVESYTGSPDAIYWTNAVTEVVVGRDCMIDHNKLQQESLGAFHTAAMHVELERNSHFISHNTTLGGRLTRNDLSVRMAGEYAYAILNGLVVIGGNQVCDNHTLLHHDAPNCPSHELYKHVLDDKAYAVFKGQIYVAQEAQKTDSKQTSKTLLLSGEANMNSQPALEIYADDVKCTHGSTIGPVDQQMLFYLRSRGIGIDAALHLLTYAFAADVTRRITAEPVRARVEDVMAAQHGLPQDLRITDLSAFDAEVL
ncbi:MAG: Fe-S cluster assembly protein SufD [Phycisphaerales bacterium]|nr:Fe-S cluster assembly protein SufD [Phycisphaerales bacterium]